MILGIDASNITQGGGITHISELLKKYYPKKQKFKKIIIWGNKKVLNSIENKKYIIKKHSWTLEKNFFVRFFWQTFFLPLEAKKNNCNTLFVLGGIFIGKFNSYVTICQNLLPFLDREWKNYSFFKRVKMFFQKQLQKKTIKNANQVIFLTKSSKKIIEGQCEKKIKKSEIINHGLNKSFDKKPRKAKKINLYSRKKPFTILYVSKIEMYKHQWNVSQAVLNLVNKGYHLKLILAGPSYDEAFKKLEKVIDSKNLYIKYVGELSRKHLIKTYIKSDLSIFASTCETFGQPLIESMLSGLPLIASNFSVVKEVTGGYASYFNSQNVKDIEIKIEKFISSPKLRYRQANKLYNYSKKYSWDKATRATFSLLAESATNKN